MSSAISDPCEIGVIVSNIPKDTDLREIHLHFMARKNGGCGDVKSICWDPSQSEDNTKAVRIAFEFDSTFASIIARSHVIGGSELKLTPIATMFNGTQLSIHHLDSLANLVYPEGFASIYQGALRDERTGDRSNVLGFYQIQLCRRIVKESSATQTDPTIDDVCVICQDQMTLANSILLDRCPHRFHSTCILQTFRRMAYLCPLCKTPYGVMIGSQPPNGQMIVTERPGSIRGFGGDSHLQINYEIPGGIQGAEDPNPGQPYRGISTVVYLPNIRNGRVIKNLFRLAFDHRLIFSLNQYGQVVFNDKITQKTQMTGCLGYPDYLYLDKVAKELAEFGLEKNMVDSE